MESTREVSKAEGEAEAKEWREQAEKAGDGRIGDIMFMETSALNNENVTETFKGLVKLMMKQAPSKEVAKAKEEPKAKETGDKAGGCKCVIS